MPLCDYGYKFKYLKHTNRKVHAQLSSMTNLIFCQDDFYVKFLHNLDFCSPVLNLDILAN